ncbi:MAG: glycosyltransferase family 2 protein [Sedimentisphaerales bacterium]|nr:glycosyltransferase family 2 protein [Sedimentisphaerales bacterium]
MNKVIESLSLFFPCFNEQDNIGPLIRSALAVVPEITDDFELIIVNDGSRDNTSAVAAELANEFPQVRVIEHAVNSGYGVALQSGFRAATKQWVFYTDGDGQFDMNELKDIIPLAQKYDIVTCYRKDRQDNIVRKLNGWAWCKLVNLLFGLGLRDIDCAFKLYRREMFDNMELVSRGALIDTEVLARAKKAGYSMVQYGVCHYPRRFGSPTGGNIKVILKAFGELFKLRKVIG